VNVAFAGIMTNVVDPEWDALQRIARALGVPVEQLFANNPPVSTDECLRLWSKITTDEGRRQALNALRMIVDLEKM
jgi:pyrroloquinoline quinone (PQQ) biosynthesis protein C